MIMINFFRQHAFPKKTADSPHKLADILTCCCRDLIFDSLLWMLDNIFPFRVSLISFDILPNWNYAAITSVKSPPYIEDLSFLLSRCLSHIPLSSAVVIFKSSRKAGYIRLFTGYQTDPASFLSLPSPLRGLRPGRHPEEDDIVPELARSIHPRERPDWEETISAMVRSPLLAVSHKLKDSLPHHTFTKPVVKKVNSTPSSCENESSTACSPIGTLSQLSTFTIILHFWRIILVSFLFFVGAWFFYVRPILLL